MIEKGILKPGDRLLPERELARMMNIARGTINKAYVELEKNRILETVQGGGTFVSKRQDILEEGCKGKAVELINRVIDELEILRLKSKEIHTLFEIRMLEREKIQKKVRIAAVDCNPEALSIFKKQLSYISNVEIFIFLLDEVDSSSSPENIFTEFGIILTTSTHYGKLTGLHSTLRDRIIQATVSPNRQTIIDLVTIAQGSTIGIICRSRKFLEIIMNSLKSLEIDTDKVKYAFEGPELNLDAFLKQTFIISPDFIREAGSVQKPLFDLFSAGGGRIILFEYQIERGSMMYIEEQISNTI
ncbi:MAG: GntR family transcriptional regulator [Firmicutes bacterium]|nr:GntR family transcriptional regulator [Bacillota bacterium]